MQKQLAAIALLLSTVGLGLGCSASNDPDGPSPATGPGEGGSGSTTAPTGGVISNFGGTGGFVVDEGVGLNSSVFGSLDDLVGAGGTGVVVEPCDYGDTPTCDFSRVDTCCSHLACSRASSNPDDTYPIEACEGLLACVQNNAGCSTAADPVCFLDASGQEDPNSICADEVYLASHTDPEGPYVHTLELINCLCGY